ncbi:GNAT family N-acetyltransferase [Weissella ceti]|uniref:GNAT family N-acetyltransferase n=1 Tax=Weissella ceti TaxID=759620 RepID=UPI001BCC8FEB|nr:GNAT family N-acetyltransferase [Weissella ceti]QVK12610.1 GNAT family N-acetyltransferase [Weissella ceti]
MTNYLFESERLGFKELTQAVRNETIRMNSDSDVMKYFPEVMSAEESIAYIDSAIEQQNKYGYSKYAVYLKDSDTFIGIIGLFQINFESEIFGEVEIGWRLLKGYWHHGYATEGAERVIKYGFNELNLSAIYSFTAVKNKPSEKVMERIGMAYKGTFNHPKLDKGHPLEQHVLYEITQ